jgi:hypothetical protein
MVAARAGHAELPCFPAGYGLGPLDAKPNNSLKIQTKDDFLIQFEVFATHSSGKFVKPDFI